MRSFPSSPYRIGTFLHRYPLLAGIKLYTIIVWIIHNVTYQFKCENLLFSADNNSKFSALLMMMKTH